MSCENCDSFEASEHAQYMDDLVDDLHARVKLLENVIAIARAMGPEGAYDSLVKWKELDK